MSILSTIKGLVGADEGSRNTFECKECGATFERHMDADDPYLRCEECQSSEVEPLAGA